jgi:hypothetical protein
VILGMTFDLAVGLYMFTIAVRRAGSFTPRGGVDGCGGTLV